MGRNSFFASLYYYSTTTFRPYHLVLHRQSGLSLFHPPQQPSSSSIYDAFQFLVTCLGSEHLIFTKLEPNFVTQAAQSVQAGVSARALAPLALQASTDSSLSIPAHRQLPIQFLAASRALTKDSALSPPNPSRRRGCFFQTSDQKSHKPSSPTSPFVAVPYHHDTGTDVLPPLTRWSLRGLDPLRSCLLSTSTYRPDKRRFD